MALGLSLALVPDRGSRRASATPEGRRGGRGEAGSVSKSTGPRHSRGELADGVGDILDAPKLRGLFEELG